MRVTYKKFQDIYRVENESLEDISALSGISMFALQKQNGISHVSAGDYIELVLDRSYVVKPLDSIKSISRKLGISEQMLIQKNSIRQIFIGQILYY